MNKRETLDFLQNYRDEFILLSDIIKEVDTVRENHYSKYSVEARQLAIELTERWIKEVFALSWDDSVTLPTKDEPSLYVRLEEDLFTKKSNEQV